MKYLTLILTVFILAAACGLPLDVSDTEDVEQFNHIRDKRQTKWGASDRGFGVSHQGSASSGSHTVGGGAYASKNWGSHGLKPDNVGGHVSYGHSSGTSAFAGADHTRHQGTDVSAGVRQNIHQGKNFGVDVSGQYGRHYGGPGGTGKASSGVSLNAHGKF